MKINWEQLRENVSIRTYVQRADDAMKAIGYTEHGTTHVEIVCKRAKNILKSLGLAPERCELAAIAGYLHDIGNIVSRTEHAQTSAVMAFYILNGLNTKDDDVKTNPVDTDDGVIISADKIADIITAIGNHDEGIGLPVNDIAAALILADKSDVRRNRVRSEVLAKIGDNPDRVAELDIHNRVNYSVKSSELQVNKSQKTITLSLEIDTRFSTVLDYFEIFTSRMLLCRKAAKKLGLQFNLNINGHMLT